MDRTTLKNTLHGVISQAVQFVDSELTPRRAEAAEYYKGEKLGNEEEGRSQFVVTEVRDGIQGVLPSLLRVFFGAERAVEFIPPGETTQDALHMARQATDAVQFIFAEECGGFLKSHAVAKDGLIKRLGVFKWGRDETPRVKMLRGQPREVLEAVMIAQPDAEPIHVVEHDDGTVDAELRLPPTQRPCVWAVPPEEFLFDRNARDIESALFLGHRTRKSRGDLLALGISEADLDEHGGDDGALLHSEEAALRAPGEVTEPTSETEAGEANEGILYVEAYVMLDVRGTGTATRYKVCTIGPNYHPVTEPEPVDHAPFSVFIPDPEPHTVNGQSWADRLMDLQRAKSMLLRTTLDSFVLSVYPRTAYVEGQVAVEDILNNEIGAPIRMRAPGMVQPFTHPFQGREAYPLMEYFDAVAERRTGQNKGAMGIDADALQSSTKGAVEAAVTSSQEHKEMLARMFAEQALKPLFRGLLKLLREIGPAPRSVRYKDSTVRIDPSQWEEMDVQVNVAIGQGSIEQRVASLAELAAFQKEVLTMLGPSNPLCTVGHLRNTIARVLELRGIRDTSTFLNEVPLDWQPPPNPNPEPNPEMQLVQIEAAKAKAQSEAKMQELQIKVAELQAQMQLKQAEHQANAEAEFDRLAMDREKMQQEFELKAQELELKYSTQLRGADLELQKERERIDAEDDRFSMQQEAEERRAQMQLMHDDAKHAREIDSRERSGAAERETKMQQHELTTAVKAHGEATKHEVTREGQKLQAKTTKETAKAKQDAAAEPEAPKKKRRVNIIRDDNGRAVALEEADD